MNPTVAHTTLPNFDFGEYQSLAEMVISQASIIEPPERLSVSQWSEKYRYVNNKGSYVGYWRNSTTPYMIEPMDMLNSPYHDAVIMCAPAQCGKTDALIVNWTGFTIHGDPMDMMIVNPTKEMSRDFSMRRVDKLLRDTKEVGALLNKDKSADNIGDKHFSNGVFLSLTHPSVSTLSSRPIPRVALTEYDRMPDDVGGDGTPFDLAAKRTTTFGSYKMALAESSPSRPIEDPHWIEVKGSHEAPPTKGIFSLYNRGDRRRWYWPCPKCERYFEGTFSMLKWNEKSKDLISLAESVYMECPHCKARIEQSERYGMQQHGMWVKDGQYFDRFNNLQGYPRQTRTASFWLRGVAAAFVSWGQLVTMYLTAEDEYKRTGSEESLTKFFNTDLAEPYIPKAMTQQRLPEHLKNRAVDLGEQVVPKGVRCLIANIDVQKNRFVVQVHGISMGTPFDITVIDRFDIRKSKRQDADGDFYSVRPATFLEDWDLIKELVMEKTYPLDDGSGRVMGISMTTCDSGGYSREKGESTTSMAYDFYRKLKRERQHARFHLVKGINSTNSPRTNITYPDASKKDALSAARGDVPVLMLNSNALKDIVTNRLDAVDIGTGVILFPDWLSIQFFQELCAEVRKPNGWEKIAHQNNEAWDLLYYCIGVAISKLMMIDRVDWSKPPARLAEWDSNPMVFTPTVAEIEENNDNDVIVGEGEISRSDSEDRSQDTPNAYTPTYSWDDVNERLGD